MKTAVKPEILETTVGAPGRMMSGSKSGYRKAYPENYAVFNANLVVAQGDDHEKIWHGDLDLTVDHEKIIKLSEEINAPIYVLYEMDARFENEESPLVENAIAVYNAALPQGAQVTLMPKRSEYAEVSGNVIKLVKP